jgi:hypothetical protein
VRWDIKSREVRRKFMKMYAKRSAKIVSAGYHALMVSHSGSDGFAYFGIPHSLLLLRVRMNGLDYVKAVKRKSFTACGDKGGIEDPTSTVIEEPRPMLLETDCGDYIRLNSHCNKMEAFNSRKR